MGVCGVVYDSLGTSVAVQPRKVGYERFLLNAPLTKVSYCVSLLDGVNGEHEHRDAASNRQFSVDVFRVREFGHFFHI